MCLQMKLCRKGAGRHVDRFIYIRSEHTGRRLEHARTWRILGGLPRKRRRHRRLTAPQLSRDLYWSPEIPDEDLKAQLIIALVQLGLLEEDWSVEWLVRHLCALQAGMSREIAFPVASHILWK